MLLHIGQPLSMDATVSAHVAQKRLSCLLIVSNINGSPYSQAVLHFPPLQFGPAFSGPAFSGPAFSAPPIMPLVSLQTGGGIKIV